jgi:hypothetical protein
MVFTGACRFGSHFRNSERICNQNSSMRGSFGQETPKLLSTDVQAPNLKPHIQEGMLHGIISSTTENKNNTFIQSFS